MVIKYSLFKLLICAIAIITCCTHASCAQTSVGYGIVCDDSQGGPCTEGDFIRINLNTGDITCLGQLNPLPSDFIAASTFVNCALYGVDFQDDLLYKIDTSTYQLEVVGPVNPVPGHKWNGLAVHPSTGKLYASSEKCGFESAF